MAENSKIEWTHHTFNPWRGCSKVSPGCANCYADTLSKRNPGTLGVWGPDGTRVVASETAWREPLRWDHTAAAAGQRHRVFCASLGDVFEDWTGRMTAANGNPLWWCHGSLSNSPIPSVGLGPGCRWADMTDVRCRLFFQTIPATPHLDWLVLTKRPENFRHMLPDHWFDQPRPNVWLGVSVEDQQHADERIPLLLDTPAAVRFLSCEPLLGPVDLRKVPGLNKLPGVHAAEGRGPAGIDWVIVGGESGPGARPCNIAWVRSIVKQCQAANVPCFVKQIGSRPVTADFFANGAFRPHDRKGGDPAEWPPDLRVREFPQPRQET